jgi:hypothetical protein
MQLNLALTLYNYILSDFTFISKIITRKRNKAPTSTRCMTKISISIVYRVKDSKVASGRIKIFAINNVSLSHVKQEMPYAIAANSILSPFLSHLPHYCYQLYTISYRIFMTGFFLLNCILAFDSNRNRIKKE